MFKIHAVDYLQYILQYKNVKFLSNLDFKNIPYALYHVIGHTAHIMIHFNRLPTLQAHATKYSERIPHKINVLYAALSFSFHASSEIYVKILELDILISYHVL